MSKLVPPHGSKELKPLLLDGQAREEELQRAQTLKRVPLSSRETGDLIMMGIGAFTPLGASWAGTTGTLAARLQRCPTTNNLFWPIPITLSAD